MNNLSVPNDIGVDWDVVPYLESLSICDDNGFILDTSMYVDQKKVKLISMLCEIFDYVRSQTDTNLSRSDIARIMSGKYGGGAKFSEKLPFEKIMSPSDLRNAFVKIRGGKESQASFF